MLLKADALADIKSGKIDIVFRRWKRSTVKAGGTLMTAVGVLAIDAVDPIRIEDITADELRRAGVASLDAFKTWLDTMKEGDLCRIKLHADEVVCQWGGVMKQFAGLPNLRWKQGGQTVFQHPSLTKTSSTPGDGANFPSAPPLLRRHMKTQSIAVIDETSYEH